MRASFGLPRPDPQSAWPRMLGPVGGTDRLRTRQAGRARSPILPERGLDRGLVEAVLGGPLPQLGHLHEAKLGLLFHPRLRAPRASVRATRLRAPGWAARLLSIELLLDQLDQERLGRAPGRGADDGRLPQD